MLKRVYMTSLAVAAAAAVFLISGGDLALAQVTVTPVVVEQSPWQALMAQVMAGLVPIASTVVLGVIVWLATWVREKYKIDVDAGLQQSLHSAVMSGILFGLQRIGYSKMPETQMLTDAQRSTVVATALDYTKLSVPEAVAKTKATDAKIMQLASGKVEGIEAGLIVPTMPGAAPANAVPVVPAAPTA